MSGKLYVVGTPIGNLGDLSSRVCEVFETVDFIAAEDTRNTRKLLSHLDIHKELISYYEHNKSVKGQYLVERMLSGESCALVTDAGMPAISDPGEEIVRLCHEHGIDTVVIPGPCAAICALALSGLPSSTFTFEGFLPSHASDRNRILQSLIHETRTMIFYEAPHRLIQTLSAMYEILNDRRIAIVKEITKIHENVWYTTLSQAQTLFSDTQIKGEFVLVVEGVGCQEVEITDEYILQLIQDKIENGVSKSEAVKKISLELDLPKNRVYKLANQL